MAVWYPYLVSVYGGIVETDKLESDTGMESTIDFSKPWYLGSINYKLIDQLYDRNILIILEALGYL